MVPFPYVLLCFPALSSCVCWVPCKPQGRGDMEQSMADASRGNKVLAGAAGERAAK